MIILAHLYFLIRGGVDAPQWTAEVTLKLRMMEAMVTLCLCTTEILSAEMEVLTSSKRPKSIQKLRHLHYLRYKQQTRPE
jgi:hypothetical protein